MSSYTLRSATQSDSRAIRELIWQVGINPVGLDWRRFVVAIDEQGRLAGCGQVKPHFDGSRELASIAVQPRLQGQGIGSTVVRWLLEEHLPPLYLTCVDSRVSFYRRFGFETLELGEMPRYYRLLVSGHRFFRRLFRWPERLAVMVKRI